MRRFGYQAVVVFVTVGFLTYLTDHLGFQSGLNTLWMFGLPIAVAMLANKDAASRCLAGLGLVVLSPISLIVTVAALGLGL
jgi:hypothetical protein